MSPLSDFSPTLNAWFNASGEYAGPAEFRVEGGPLIRGRIAWPNYVYVHNSKCKMFHVEHFSILQAGESPAGHGPQESTCFSPAFLHLK